jgi:hypothetical protein
MGRPLKRTPIVCIMEPGNIHEHAMLNEAIGFRCTTLEEALTVIKAILADAVHSPRRAAPALDHEIDAACLA